MPDLEHQNPPAAAGHELSADKQRALQQPVSTAPAPAPAPVGAPYDHDTPYNNCANQLQRRRRRLLKTPPLAWATAAACAILWVLVILSGVAVLVVYLVFRPRSPRLEISSATLNGAYLDMGALLNADLTVLANFTNPNHKADVSFSYLAVDLYYADTLIATRAIEPFAEASGETVIRSVHMVSSEVELAAGAAQGLRRQVENESVAFRMEGTFRTRLDLDGFLHFSYWLYSSCTVVVSSPPSGVLVSSKCRTKR